MGLIVAGIPKGLRVIVVRSLGSGSSGNAIVVDTGESVIAVDCGVGTRELVAGLRASGRQLRDLTAVLLTHEHTDHIRALPRVVASHVPVIATQGTARATRLPMASWTPIMPTRPVMVGRTEVTAIAVSHDAAEPCGYHLRHQGHAITVLTDLGAAHASLLPYLAEAHLIVLEANHDVEMLRLGPYPAHLKRRVLSAKGHLSNAASGDLLATALASGATGRTIWLAHLSTTNNRPELARSTVVASLDARGLSAPVIALPRYDNTVVWQTNGHPAAPASAQLGLGL